MKKLKRFFIICGILLLILTLHSCKQPESAEMQEETETSADFHIEEFRYIIHGGGVLKAKDQDGEWQEYLGSSSIEALNQCASAGETAIELDFNFTSDNHLVCVHHWGKEFNERFLADSPPTLEEFLNCKIYDHFSPVSISELETFLKNNPDIFIVTDIKDRNLEGVSYIAQTLPHLKNQFVIQIYNEEEYQPVRRLGFDKIIYTLYNLSWEEKTNYIAINKFVQKNPCVAITFDHVLCEVTGYVENMQKCGVPLMIHTVNGREEQQKYFDMGIFGVYTDDVGHVN